MPASPSEKQRIERAQAGDQQAMTELYELHAAQIYRYISYRVPQTEAEDLTAEVFVRMIEGLPDFTYTGAPFEAWLYRIAAARVADYHRKNNRRQHEEIDEQLTDQKPLPEDFLLQDQEYERVRDALQKLSEDDQTLLILRFVERRSHRETADILGKTEAALRTAQHRALKRLAKYLDVEQKERHYLRGSSDPED